MKKLNSTYNRGVHWVIAGLLTLLGFSACKKELPVEYGVPRATYVVSGKVTDTQGQALSQIRVIVPKADHYQWVKQISDTLYTKPDGGFEYTYEGMPTNTVQIHLKIEDSSLHPLFETDSTRVDFKHSDLKGGDGRWYDGTAKKEVSIALKSKQEE